MSLKNFHIVLISLSALVTLVFGGWSVRAWTATGEGGHLAMAVFSFALAAGLVVYIVWFARKIRTRQEGDRRRRNLMRPLTLTSAILWLSSRPAGACSVCYGEADGPMIDAARVGVWTLFALVLVMQVSFFLFFMQLRRRSRAHATREAELG